MVSSTGYMKLKLFHHWFSTGIREFMQLQSDIKGDNHHIRKADFCW